MAFDNFEQQYPNNPDISSEINKAMISQTNLPGMVEDPNLAAQGQGLEVDPYSQQLVQNFNTQFSPAAIGPQGAGLYPGLRHNINVGGTSGSIIGAGNIYVPGGNIMAIDPVLARRKAIDDAAKERAAALKPFEYEAPYKLKDARFQEKFNKSYYNKANEMIDKAKEKYGKDFSIVLGNQDTKEGREFIQTMANYEVLGREFDQVVDLMAGIDEGLQDKTKVYTPETLKLKNEFEKLVGNFDKGDVFSTKDLQVMYDKLKGQRSFEDYIQNENFLSDIKGQLSQYGYDKDKGDFYVYGTGKRVKFEDAIQEVVDSLAERDFAPEVMSGLYDKDYMKKAIGARLKDSYEQTRSLTTKPKDFGSGTQIAEEGTTYGGDENARSKTFEYDESGNVVGESQNAVFYSHDINTTELGKRGAIKLDNPVFTGTGALSGRIPGVSEVQLTGIETTTKYDETKGEAVPIVTLTTKTEVPVKKYIRKETTGANKGKEVEITPNEFNQLSPQERANVKTVEKRQVVDKAIELDDHTFNQVRNQLPEDARNQFDKAVGEARKVASTKTSKTSTMTPVGGAEVDEFGIPIE